MDSSDTPSTAASDFARRDFLMVATGALGTVGALITAWPFINILNPAADTLSFASIEVNIASIEVRQGITAK